MIVLTSESMVKFLSIYLKLPIAGFGALINITIKNNHILNLHKKINILELIMISLQVD